VVVTVRFSPEGPEAKLATAITSRSTPREGFSGFSVVLIAPGLAALGLVALLAGALLLRSLGARYRVGRLLAATPEASIDEAISLACGAPVYVRVKGRISSDEEFPDEHDRPLVFRRKRIEVASPGGRWRTLVDEREAVPFGIESRSSFIAVDETALVDGLVSVPRHAGGRVSDLPLDLLADADASNPGAGETDPPARLVVEQLSAVEHATVCGRPALRDGKPLLTAGAGRPLIVTTLEAPAAMRVLAAAHRGRVIAAAGLLLAGLGLFAAALIALALGA